MSEANERDQQIAEIEKTLAGAAMLQSKGMMLMPGLRMRLAMDRAILKQLKDERASERE